MLKLPCCQTGSSASENVMFLKQSHNVIVVGGDEPRITSACAGHERDSLHLESK